MTVWFFGFYYSVSTLPLLNIFAKPVQGVNVIYAMPTEQYLGFHAVSVKKNMQTEFRLIIVKWLLHLLLLLPFFL